MKNADSFLATGRTFPRHDDYYSRGPPPTQPTPQPNP